MTKGAEDDGMIGKTIRTYRFELYVSCMLNISMKLFLYQVFSLYS